MLTSLDHLLPNLASSEITDPCFIIMLAISYGNGWYSKSLPFMSTKLLTAEGKKYPITKVLPGGVLDKDLLAGHGTPRIARIFAYAMFMAIAAISGDAAS